MKKLLVLTALALCGCSIFSQELGVRGGEVLGNHIAIDAMLRSGKFNRLHVDVSFGDDKNNDNDNSTANGGVGVELLWDFLYRPLGGEAFYWYLGAGPSLLFGNDFWLGISGEAGLEYRFKTVPIALGADWRPTFWIIDNTNFSGGGFGFNARFVFGQKKK
jgi:hypothetical protein